MHNMIGLVLFAIILYFIYQRYAPIKGVPCIDLRYEDSLREKAVVVDIRDYNLSANEPVEGVFVLPYAYLKRHYGTIQGKDIVLVVSDLLALNLSVRFLRRKGFNVIGCYMK